MSLGKELASIRKSKNLTLEDIQNAVKIPLDTLKSIENDRIFSDSSRNITYVRSFVRSYAKYLKIEDEVIVKALDEIYEGTYSGSLYDDGEETEADQTDSVFESGQETTNTSDIPSEKREKTEKPAPTPVKPQPVQNDMDSINWADMGRKFTTASKSSKAWVIVIAVVIVALLAGSGFYFWDDINDYISSSNNQTEQTAEPGVENEALIPTPVDSLDTEAPEETATDAEQPEVNSATEQNQPEPEPVEFGDRLTVVVYAAYGQLEPVRVTSDINWRTNPFWMEQGEAYNFDFRDTLLVRGQYSRMLLLFNGNVIENPRQNYFDPSFNSIMITRSILNQERYLTPPEEFPLEVGPPDSVIYRIRY